MGKLAPQVTIAMTGIAEMYYVLKLTSLRFAFIAAVKRGRGPQAEQLKQTRDARNAHAGDRHPFPYGGWAVIRIIMVVCVKLVGQALPRAWAVGTARKMAYTARLECCWGDGGGGGVAVAAVVGACPGVLLRRRPGRLTASTCT